MFYLTKKPRWLIFGAVACFVMLLAGCAPQARIKVYRPAEISTKGIRKVAVGRFEIIQMNREFKAERDGQWRKKQIRFTAEQLEAISNQIRARVINLLSVTPYFQLVYTDEFQKLENDEALQKAVAAGGYRTADIDAVINGKIWLEVVNIDAKEVDKVKLEFAEGGDEDSFNYEVEVLAYWPYKSIRGSLALEMKLTRIDPTEVVAVILDTREAAYKVGGPPDRFDQTLAMNTREYSRSLARSNRGQDRIEESDQVLPSFDQLVADLAESVAARFIQRVAVTEQEVEYPIAVDGNETAVMLIEVGAYEKAIETLNRVLDRAREKNPDDIYNLGLCYEAIGEYGLAGTVYNDAITADPENLMYARGVGRIERLKRENRMVRAQLSSK